MARTYRRDSIGRFSGGGSPVGGKRQTVRVKPGAAKRSLAAKQDKAISRYKDQGRSPTTTGIMERGAMRTRQLAQREANTSRFRKSVGKKLVQAGVRKAKANANYARSLGRDIREGLGGSGNVAVMRSEQQSGRRQARRDISSARATRSRLQRRRTR
jgi:hypothetical protein